MFVNTLKIIRQTLNLIIFLQIDIKHPRICPKADHEFKKKSACGGLPNTKVVFRTSIRYECISNLSANDSLTSWDTFVAIHECRNGRLLFAEQVVAYIPVHTWFPSFRGCRNALLLFAKHILIRTGVIGSYECRDALLLFTKWISRCVCNIVNIQYYLQFCGCW